MNRTGIMDEMAESSDERAYELGITSGKVVDVNDPLQRGRIKVFCPTYGDVASEIEHIPWASYCAPFAGVSVNPTTGPDEDTTGGVMSYGTWAIPDVGATALVTLVDGLPNRRVWIGCLQGDYFTHTMPHGRFKADSKVPLSSTEKEVEPLASNAREAFNNNVDSYEYGTRIIDRQVSAISAESIGTAVTYSEEPDDIDFNIDRSDGKSTKFTQGYSNNRSSIYSTTTPGRHSSVMDDDPQNSRIRFRTATGHQVILDDTNERIYIGTALGNTWIEIDGKGTIDIYSSEDTSIHSDGDLNLSAGKSVRIAGAKGIHLASGKDIRMHSKESTHVRSDGDLKMHSPNTVSEVDGDLAFKVGGKVSIKSDSVAIETDGNINLKATDLMIKTNGYNFNGTGINVVGELGAGTNVIANGNVFGSDCISPLRSLNAHEHFYIAPKIPEPPPSTIGTTFPSFPSGATSTPTVIGAPDTAADDEAKELPAYLVSRSPTHEPFPRSYLNKDETDKEQAGESSLELFDKLNVDNIATVTEYGYDDPNVGRKSDQRSIDFDRNEKWRR